MLVKILTADAPSITSERKTVPPHVGHALAKALEKLPADRFTSAAEFATALGDESFTYKARARTSTTTTQEPVDAQAPATMPGPWKRLTVATTTLAALFAVAFGWLLLRPDPPQRVSRQVLSTNGWAGLGGRFGYFAAIAPDGSSMILPARGQLALKMRGSTEITPIPDTEGGRAVVYHPDGQWIAYALGSDLFKRPLIGGSPVRLAEDADVTVVGLAWLDDGTVLYEQGGGDPRTIAQISEEGGEPLVVMEVPAPLWLHGLPGAQSALMIACPGSGTCLFDRSNLYVVDLGNLSSDLLLEQIARAWYTPTGHVVYVRPDGAVFAVPFDPGALAITGGAVPLLNGVRFTGATADMRLGADGTLLYVEGSAIAGPATRQLLIADLDGNEEALPLAPRTIQSVGWSPDGQSVVYASGGQIYTYNVALGTTPSPLSYLT